MAIFLSVFFFFTHGTNFSGDSKIVGYLRLRLQQLDTNYLRARLLASLYLCVFIISSYFRCDYDLRG